MSEERKLRLIKVAFNCVTCTLEADLDGDEQLLKEAWEAIESDEEEEYVKDLVRGMLDSLGALRKKEIDKAGGAEY